MKHNNTAVCSIYLELPRKSYNIRKSYDREKNVRKEIYEDYYEIKEEESLDFLNSYDVQETKICR